MSSEICTRICMERASTITVSGCGAGSDLAYPDLFAQILHCLLNLIARSVSIDVHGCLDVLVTHDSLDHFHVTLVFTEPCAEGVAENMRGEVWEQFWITVLLMCLIRFLFIVA